MTSFIDYIESSCKGLKENRMTYLYKRHLLDSMTERANEITYAGITDEKVITDIIADEFGDLEKGFSVFEKEEKKRMMAKKLRIILPVGGFISLILILIAYFIVSNITGAWNKTWLIIVGGIFAMVIFYLSFGIRKLCSMSMIFHTAARGLIAICTMLVSVFVFLFCLMMFPDVITWPIVIGGVPLMLLSDLGFAYASKQKFRTITFFIYMPVIATMLYIILAAYGIITWAGGWPFILLGLVVDLVYILAVISSNMKYFMYKQEVDE